MAKKHLMRDLFDSNSILSCARTPASRNPISTSSARSALKGPRLPAIAFSHLLKKLAAAGLTLSLATFTCFAQALPEDVASAPPVSNPSAASSPPGPAAPLPVPTVQQTAKARDAFRKGTSALQAQDSPRALKLFAEAHRLDPGNGSYLAAYELARQQWVGGMVQAARHEENAGKNTSAKQELEQALSLDPGNPYVQEHIQSLATEEDPAVVASEPMPTFSSGLVELIPRPIRSTFHLRGNAQQILHQVFSAYGITTILDDSVPAKQIQFDLTNASFTEASTAAQLATGTFTVPLDPEHVLIALDTKENRSKFDRLLLETIFLPGLDPKEMTNTVNLVKSVFGVQQASSRDDQGTLSIRAPENTLRAINATLGQLYLEKPEVVLDVRVYQVNDSRQENLGAAFPQQLSVFNVASQLTGIISSNQSTIAQLISAGLVNPGDVAGIAALLVGLGLVSGTVLNQPFALFGNGLTLSGLSFGSTTVNASLNISNTREIDHVQLRAGDLEKQSFLIGSRYPIVTQSYSAGSQTPTGSTPLASLLAGTSGAAASTASNPLSFAPTVQYQDLGLTVKAQPSVLQNQDVQMQLQITLASLAGTSVNGSPIINNRSFITTIQVPNDGAALIASSVSRTESTSLSGIPGLSELPGFAWTASPVTQVTVGKLLIVISPHIVSATHTRTASQMLSLLPQTTGR